MMTVSAFTGAKLNVRSMTAQAPRTRVVTSCQIGRRESFAAAALAVAIAIAPAAHADLVSDLVAKSTANADLHNKQRLATSYANFARSRSVTDGTCKFPKNVLGCDGVAGFASDVAFIADDMKIECEGKAAGKCASNISIPQSNK